LQKNISAKIATKPLDPAAGLVYHVPTGATSGIKPLSRIHHYVRLTDQSRHEQQRTR
jgi:hypothetical protein